MAKDYSEDEDFSEDDEFDGEEFSEDLEDFEKLITTNETNTSKKNVQQPRAKIEKLLEEKRLRKELEKFDFDEFDDFDD